MAQSFFLFEDVLDKDYAYFYLFVSSKQAHINNQAWESK
jgi:hypothetical protein